MRGTVQHLGYGAFLDEPAVVHDGDAIPQMLRIVCRSWEMNRKVSRSSCWSLRSNRRISARTETSSDEVGSSSTTTLGWVARARAMLTRCCWPPDRLVRIAVAEGQIERNELHQVLHPRRQLTPAQLRVDQQRLGDRGSDAYARVERLVGLPGRRSRMSRRQFRNSVASAPTICRPSTSIVPASDFSRPSTQRATVDFPEPLSPTSPSEVPARDREADSVHSQDLGLPASSPDKPLDQVLDDDRRPAAVVGPPGRLRVEDRGQAIA